MRIRNAQDFQKLRGDSPMTPALRELERQLQQAQECKGKRSSTAVNSRDAQGATQLCSNGSASQTAAPGKPRRGEIEGEEQALVIEQFRLRHPLKGPLLIHIPNGGSRKNKFEGYRLKKQGVRAGVSDLLLPVARGGFIGLWIEFKAEPPNDAAVTDSQREWLELMAAEGYKAEICLGVDAALAVLEDYMSMPPSTIQAAW